MTKILVIEDESALLEEIMEWLQFEDYEVYGAANGREGLQIALQQLPDLIVSDVMMPDIDGHRVLLALRTHPATALTPFIFLTALADQRDIRRGMNLGADDYVTKPFNRKDLLEAIRSRLDRHALSHQQSTAALDELRGRVLRALPHELRTPLFAILGFGELLAHDPASHTPAEIAEMASSIIRAGKRLLHLTDNYLLYVRLVVERNRQGWSPGRLENPTAIIADTVEERVQEYGRQGDPHLDLANAALAIDAENFQKIAYELVDNALKFSTRGTPVQVTGRCEQDGWVLTVSDRGRGIAAAHLRAIGAFGQFDRTIYEQQGSGMGLVIVKLLTDLHHGKFAIESQVGAGTTVSVQTPLAGRPSAADGIAQR